MPNLFNYPWLRRLFNKGVNTDLRPEVLPEGIYRDAFNMRPSSIMGDTGAVEAVRGEVILYPTADPNAPSYTCIGASSVNGHVVAFWASNVAGNAPVIVVDGVVSAQSALIPYTYNHPLQIAVQESCKDGILFPVDGFSDPLYWDVEDLIANQGTQKYFTAFNPDSVSVGLNMPANYFVLDRNGLTDLGGPVGLPVGKYKYYPAYEDASGNRTNWGLDTPWISVPNIIKSTNVYARTVGGEPNPLVNTNWGIPLWFRVDNQVGFSTLVIRRDRINDGSGLTGVTISEIVARIPIVPGQFGVISWTDPTDANAVELLPTDETAQSFLNIKAPKTVEYADGRLIYGNFEGDPQNIGLTYRSSGGDIMFPFTKSLTDLNGNPQGYEHVFIDAYYKRYQADKYSFGIQTWNGQFGKGFAQDMQANLQFPNRRDEKSGDSLLYSDNPLYNANNNVQGSDPVTPTYEAFIQGTKRKDDFYNIVNVSGAATDVKRIYSDFIHYDPNIPPGVNSVSGGASGYIKPNGSADSYKPWKPLENGDTDTYNIPPVTARNVGTAISPNFQPNAGNVFNPIHQALGAKIYGVQNIPSFVKAFTVVRTEAAGEVICQGIGTYDLNRAQGYTSANKSTNSVKFFSPDIQSGMVGQVVLDDMAANPQNYSIRMVSSLGFYTEQYANYPVYTGGLSPRWRSNSIDMISYGMFTEDHGQVNVGDAPVMGYQPAAGSPAPPGNYIGLAKWRNILPMQGTDPTLPNYSFWNEAGNDGNSLLNMDSFEPITEGRGSHWRITTLPYIYTPEGGTVQPNPSGTNPYTAFGSPVVRTFSQPWYIINIVRNGASVPAQNSTNYVSTYTHIKMSSCIGIYSGGVEDFRILDERWEDCTPEFGSEFRYTYIQGIGAEQVYVSLDNTYFGNPTNIALAQADILNNGFWLSPDNKQVTGFYRQVQVGYDKYLRFGEYQSPPAGSRIVVKYAQYDSNISPISVFGGDNTVSPSVFAPFDRQGSGDDVGTMFDLGGTPLPYSGYEQNPRWFLPNGGQETQQEIKMSESGTLRQWLVMASIEGKTPCALNVSVDSQLGLRNDTLQTFPDIHYVVRPMHGLPFTSGSNAGFLPQYDNDCPDEWAIFAQGGLRFSPVYNLDYAKEDQIQFKGYPLTGYMDPDYCTTVAASDRHNPTSQASPGLRTFRTDGSKSISDDQGEIKRIAVAFHGSANIYAWTQKGLCKILYNKNILTGADGSTVALQSVDNIWGEEIWLKKNAMGLPDEFWRLWSRGVAPSGASYQDTFWWPDRKGWYELVGDSTRDISRNKNLSVLLPVLKGLPDNFTPQMTAYYNETHKEMWASIAALPIFGPGSAANQPHLYVYSALTGEWLGEFGYRFDQYLCHEGNVLGMRDLQTFTLDQGYVINGVVRTATVKTPEFREVGKFKKALRWRVVGTPPDQMELYNKDNVKTNTQNAVLQDAFLPGSGFLWSKHYDSEEGYWNKVDASFDLNRPDAMDEGFFVNIVYNTEGDKEVLALENQLKNIP